MAPTPGLLSCLKDLKLGLFVYRLIMVFKNRLHKIEKKSLATEVYLHLKQSILNGSLPSGTRLLEIDIAEQMEVSRAPVREALRLLQADHLVDFQVNQGAYVKELDKDEIWEIYTARSLIEGYVASLAAKKSTPEDVRCLKEALDAVLAAAVSGDSEATVARDFEFHRLVWKISGHRLFIDILNHLEDQIRMFMTVQAPLFAHLTDSVRDHIEITEAIARGEAEAASQAIQRHITEAGTLTLSHWVEK